MHGNVVRRSVIHAKRAPSDGAEQFPVNLRGSMRTSPPLADAGIVEALTSHGFLCNVILARNLGNSLQQCSEKFQGIVLNIVRKFDKTPFLERVQKGFHKNSPKD